MLTGQLERHVSRNDASSRTTAAILLVSPFEQDHVSLGQMFHRSAWKLSGALTCGEALSHMQKHVVPVVICERDQTDGIWTDFLEDAALATYPPAVIVASRLADERLWAEVLNMGGWDVLAKPFETKEVIHCVSSAWRQWDYRRRQSGSTGQSKACGA